MGCSFSGLNAFYDAVNGGDVWINENRFKILRPLSGPIAGDSGVSGYVFLVKEILAGDGARSGLLKNKSIDPSHISDEGTYAMKKVIIQNEEQLELVKEEIRVSSLFSHPNLLPLLDHAIITVKGTQGGSQNHEAYLLFPVHLDGNLLDNTKVMQTKKEYFPTLTVLQIFRQLCAGLKHMHNFDPPYAHNDVKPGNVLIAHRKDQPPVAILMDFGSTKPARRQIRSRAEALQLQIGVETNATSRSVLHKLSLMTPLVVYIQFLYSSLLLAEVVNDMVWETKSEEPVESSTINEVSAFVRMPVGGCNKVSRTEWATEHSSEAFRAPELWDCPSHADIDERTDIWSLGCTLYAIMYGESPFEYARDESGGSMQLTVMNAQIKWPTGHDPSYPEPLRQFVVWMLQPHPSVRPHINDIIVHVDKLISKFS